ncbi:head GIN domain-containing protein [Pinibacter soli]|uniref:Head GIN domain-containing protein n=1 Tax=Pinibacter soli TaxID=3044211 RepID=A0ABT6RD31_9BACT|nr:head GIN domain-containing protein [Pinibacter soli]MDI3320483.1 head GIN domain-containing protein [Pinibacter soli]
MQKMLLSLLGLAFAMVAIAQNKVVKDNNAEVRTVGKFNAIDVSGGIQLMLSQGTQQVVASAATVEDRNNLITEVHDGVLKISFDYSLYPRGTKGKQLKVYVAVPELAALEGSSGVQITVDGSLSSGQMVLSLSSGSSFKGTMKSSKMVVHQNSGSQVSLSGSGDELVIKTSSGAVFKGYDFVAKNCTADVASGGIIETNVSTGLVAEASSGGSIRYKGTGNIVKISTGSGGSINKSN